MSNVRGCVLGRPLVGKTTLVKALSALLGGQVGVRFHSEFETIYSFETLMAGCALSLSWSRGPCWDADTTLTKVVSGAMFAIFVFSPPARLVSAEEARGVESLDEQQVRHAQKVAAQLGASKLPWLGVETREDWKAPLPSSYLSLAPWPQPALRVSGLTGQGVGSVAAWIHGQCQAAGAG